jgi:IclR family acetate operon transcriptional repressor
VDELRRRFATAAAQGDPIDVEPLIERLAQIRRDRWAIDEEETQAGLRCVGTVIDDHTGTAVAGLSVSGPIARITTDRVPELASLVCSTADQISRALGYRPTINR